MSKMPYPRRELAIPEHAVAHAVVHERGSVVGREEHQRVVRDAVGVQEPEQLTNRAVELLHRVADWTEAPNRTQHHTEVTPRRILS